MISFGCGFVVACVVFRFFAGVNAVVVQTRVAELFLPLSKPVRVTLEGSRHATTDVAALDAHQSTVWGLGEVTRFLVSFV